MVEKAHGLIPSKSPANSTVAAGGDKDRFRGDLRLDHRRSPGTVGEIVFQFGAQVGFYGPIAPVDVVADKQNGKHGKGKAPIGEHFHTPLVPIRRKDIVGGKVKGHGIGGF